MHACASVTCIRFEMLMYVRYCNLISTHRFKTIFCCRFNASFSKDAKKFWHFTSENISDFYTPTLKHETLIPYDKIQEGTHPKMLLYALDKLFHVFRGVGSNDIDGKCTIASDILSFASLCCTEQ